jgi:hypothetical protein
MPWDLEQTIQGSQRTLLPFTFTSRLLAIDITAANQQPTWYRSGFLRAILEIDGQPFVGANIETAFGQQVIELPFNNYQIDFAPRVWVNQTTIRIKQLTNTQTINIMGINNAPQGVEQLSGELTTVINANVTNVLLDPANPVRREGFIVNKSNRNLWVVFSTNAATAAAPTNLVTPGSNIDIPDNYTGPINGIWSGPTPTLNCEVHQFNAI